MRTKSLLFFASWIMLAVLSVALVFFSLGSLWLAYTGTQDSLTSVVNLDKLREIGGIEGEQAVKAFKGRRATAATWAFGCALLSAWIVLVPYRRGERWAWWALLTAVGLAQLLSLARAPMLGTTGGGGASGTILAFLLLGLMAGAPRMLSRGIDSSLS